MKPTVLSLLLVILALLAGGCGTVQCLNSSGHYNPAYQPKPPPANAVYGGVRWDLRDNPSDIAFWDFMNDARDASTNISLLIKIL